MGRIGLEQGKFDQAGEHLQESLAIAQELNDIDVIAYTLAHLGYISHYQGRYADAQKYGEESYEFAKRTGDAIAQAFSLNMLANVKTSCRFLACARITPRRIATRGGIFNWSSKTSGRCVRTISKWGWNAASHWT